jgi:hypothetical protein
VRAFLPKRENEREQVLIKQLRIDRPFLPYARRSDPTAKDAKKDKTQSREMQTEDMIQWGKGKGWRENLIFPYFADLGLSGTLPPDQRPDILRLFEDLDSGKFDHSTIGCWQENRLFRDETHIYYNQLIDKMLQHDVVLVVISPRLYIYDMRDPYDRERLREKFREAARFIPEHVKGWLHPARERAAWEDDEWAGMGDPPPGFIVDFNPKSPTYKHMIPYWPHIEKVREYFELYREMGGEMSLVYQHLRVSPIVFPEFGPEVDRANVERFKLSRYPGGGYYIKSKDTIKTMLTQPLYAGYRAVKGVIRQDEYGNKIRSFEPVIDPDLWKFAFYRLARTDLDGNPIREHTNRRFFQQDTDEDFGLLKFRVKSTQGTVRTRPDSNRPGEAIYSIQTLEECFLYCWECQAEIASKELEVVVVNRLLEHVETLSREQGCIEEYESRARTRRNMRLAKIKQIEKSIEDIDKNQGGFTRNLGKVEIEIEEAEREIEVASHANDEYRRREALTKKELKERRKELLEKEIETLELERKRLIDAKKEVEEEADDDIGTLEEELLKLKEGWPNYSFKKRRSLVNFAIQEVVVDVMSTHWIRIEVLWLYEQWGREEMYYRRTKGTSKEWSEEEIALLQAHYKTTPKLQLMALLPDRSWAAIKCYASLLSSLQGLSKPKGGRRREATAINKHEAYSDLEFRQKKNIPPNVSYTDWQPRHFRYR